MAWSGGTKGVLEPEAISQPRAGYSPGQGNAPGVRLPGMLLEHDDQHPSCTTGEGPASHILIRDADDTCALPWATPLKSFILSKSIPAMCLDPISVGMAIQWLWVHLFTNCSQSVLKTATYGPCGLTLDFQRRKESKSVRRAEWVLP